jgi:hypothetical protein
MSHALRIHDGLGQIAVDPSAGILLAYGSTVPAAASEGYAPGCRFIKTNGTGVANVEYVNVGTKASSSFVTSGIQSTSPSIGIGYATGAGGAVSQATDRTTGVTLNAVSGQITTQATSLTAQTSVSFTVTNSAVAIGDVIALSIQSGPTGTKTIATVTTVAAGSFKINLFNTDASVADIGAAIINFAVIKAVAA